MNASKEEKLIATNIKWDVSSDELGDDLPAEVDVPSGMTDDDEISDWLTDTYGFCHCGFELKKVKE